MTKWKSFFYTLLGTMLTGFSVSTLLTPNKIVCGGVSGVATILYQTLGLAPGLTFAVINVLLLLCGAKVLGKAFTLKTLLGAGLLSAFVQLFSYLSPITNHVVLASLFGGVLYGLGIGMAFAAGASTGGTDIVGRLFQRGIPRFPIGKALRIVDGAIIAASWVVFQNTELVLFGVLALFISTFTVDWWIRKLNLSRMVFVVTDKGEDVSQYLVTTSPRGVTRLPAIGAYSQEKKAVLFCALKEQELTEFQNKILRIDPAAFIVYAESQQIMGNGFHIYR